MAKRLKTLLNQKSWTGKEVGKALLMNLKNDIEEKGNPNKQPLFSQEDYNRMLDSLDTDNQYTQYKVYEGIYSAIVDSFNRNEAMIQQFYNGYYRYFLSLREAQRAEDFFSTTEKFPLILTQKQYDEMSENIGHLQRCQILSYYDLFFHTVDYFLQAVENDEAETVPEEIRKSILDTKSQKVTSKRIIANWAEDTGAGYYTLPDGTRSDNVTTEKWQDLLTDLFIKANNIHASTPEDLEDIVLEFNTTRYMNACKLLFGGEAAIGAAYKEIKGEDATEHDIKAIERELENLIDHGNTTSLTDAKKPIATQLFYNNGVDNVEWHYYTEPPTDYTKYDVLIDMLDRYRGAYKDRLTESGGEYVEEIPEREQFKEFKKDYPALADAIKTYLERAVAPTKGLKANQLYKDFITWGELADIGYLDYKELVKVKDTDIIKHIALFEKDNTENYNRRARALHHGIAIIKESNLIHKEYKDPIEGGNIELLQGIDYLENDLEEAEYIRNNIEILALPALRYMYAYNAFIEIVAAAYDIDFMTVAKYDLTRQESQIEACNNTLYTLYANVYGTEQDKKHKREFLRSYFPPIDIEALKPTEEAIAALTEKIEELGYTREAAYTLKHYQSLVNEIMREGAV